MQEGFLFLCVFHIFQEERRKGYGTEALSGMEEAARQLACGKCALFERSANMN